MKLAGGLLLLLLAGWLIPRHLISDGVDRFSDPARRAVAGRAVEAAWLLQDNPIARAAAPGARVVEVRADPGHCSPAEPGGREPYADYRARVRYHTFFGLPAGTVYVRCGGWSWSRFPD